MENPSRYLSLRGKKLHRGHTPKLASLLVPSATMSRCCGQHAIAYSDPSKEAQLFHLQETGLFEGLS